MQLVDRERAEPHRTRALASLPWQPQMLLLMVYWEEVPVVDLARAMEISASTLRTRLERARGLVRRRMADFSNQPTPADEAHLQALLRSVLASSE